MSKRYFCVEVERTVTYRRKVWVEVEETDERLKDEKHYPELLADEAKDAAAQKAKTSLAGWEQISVDYYAHTAQQAESSPECGRDRLEQR